MIDIKTNTISLINDMPDNSTIEDIMEELYFKNQVEDGLIDLRNGDFISNEVMMERVSKWIIK